MSKPLVILGTSGNALDLLDVVDAINSIKPAWEVIGFLDDGHPPGSQFAGFPVVGGLAEARRYPQCWLVNTIGSDRSFRRRPELIASTGVPLERFATLIHPAAGVSPRAQLGPGTYVCYGASVGGRAIVGRHVHLGAGCQVGHDSTIEDFVVLAAGAVVSGCTRLGRACYVGANSCTRSSVHVGEGALVGLGAVVIRDVPPGITVVGNPARPLERGRSAGGSVALVQGEKV